MKQLRLNRKTYEKVKKYDHGQMESFFRKIYEEGYVQGTKDCKPHIPDLSGLEEKLQGIRGIGQAKSRIVFQAIEEYMAGQTERK